MVSQITAFLENSKGRLADLCRTVGDAGVDMYALTIAETSDYGLIRIICSDPEKAVSALKSADFRATITNVMAVAVPNVPGGLASLLETLDANNLNIEYGYCFLLKGETAVDVLKIRDAEKAVDVITTAGFTSLSPEDLL